MKHRKRLSRRRGSALPVVFGLLAILAVSVAVYLDRATFAYRSAKKNEHDVQTSHLCESGVQSVLRSLWRQFKSSQNFTTMDQSVDGATAENPMASQTGELAGIGRYAAGVISSTQPNGSSYERLVVIRAVGWIDTNANGLQDSGEARRTVDVTVDFTLDRSKVFDYTYFVNNFGWMTGFGPNDLYINGDARSNGDFTFSSGSGTVNGSVIASYNDRLVPGAAGVVNLAPYKWTTSNYDSQINGGISGASRMRQPYDPAVHGAIGSAEFEKWRGLVYYDTASIQGNDVFGAAMQDVNGTRAWSNTSGTPTFNTIDSTPTSTLTLPDLSDFGSVTDAADPDGKRFAKSKAWTDTKATYGDGTPNPNYAGSGGTADEYNADGTPNVNYTGAYLDVYNSSTGKWVRVSSGGVVNNSALLIGTSTKPIRIHGPVTVNGDVAIAGYVQGQGTIYTSRNVHVIGSIKYKNPPDFRGNDMQAVENSIEKKDMLGLAASQSIIMGDTTSFGSYPLKYMTPPFTKPRYDDNGNLIPAYDATQTDSWGIKKYQSILQSGSTASAYKSAAAGGVNQIDAVLYTNFVGGGNVGVAGGGMTLNGTIIAKDEAIVTWSLPIRMNYDHRIKERSLNQKPLIDIDLPRSPTLIRYSWRDLGLRLD
ncbi:MAG: hypothetical protein KF857_01430 [Fimbriimonadaceae bacterium]|nr:hypothetical protein [Fimbriimonadaceae bacterium]